MAMPLYLSSQHERVGREQSPGARFNASAATHTLRERMRLLRYPCFSLVADMLRLDELRQRSPKKT